MASAVFSFLGSGSSRFDRGLLCFVAEGMTLLRADMVPGNGGVRISTRSLGEISGEDIEIDFLVEDEDLVEERDRLGFSEGGVGGGWPLDSVA